MSDYPSDLSDEQWQLIRPLLPKRAKRGRPPIDRRDIIDAVLYLVRTGCQWRQLPIDFPKWKTVYTVFWRWRKSGLWQRIHDALRGRVRQRRQAAPADGDDHGQSIDSHGRGRRRTRLRRRKKDHRPQATPGGRYLGFDLGGRRARRLLARSRRRPFRGDGFERALPAAEGHLRRQRLRPPGIARLDSSDLRLDPANGAATLPSPGLRRPAQALDRRAHVLVDHSTSPQRPGL